MFGYLSVFPLNSVRSIAKSITDGKEVIIVGHTAMFTGVNKWNTLLAEKRSQNLKSLLQIYGVKVPITTVGVGASSPITRTLTEQQQRLNRRAMIYIVPSQS
jgi:outer membrane protein OmpA-like peptidoglycan-associated protein